MTLDKLKVLDDFRVAGQEFTVTNKVRGYSIGCKDSAGKLHYFSRDMEVEKISGNDELNYFKNKLKSYIFTKKQLFKFIKKLEGKQHSLYGLTSKNPNASGIPEGKAEKIDRLSKDIEVIEEKIAYYQYDYNLVTNFLEKLSKRDKVIIKSVYVYKTATFEEITRNLNLDYSFRNVQFQVDKLILNYIKEEL